MKKIKLLLIFIISFMIYNSEVFAASATLTVDPASLNAPGKFTITVSVSDAASWDIQVTTSGSVSNCSISEKGATEDGTDGTKTFTKSCDVTVDGTIQVSLSGSVKNASGEEVTLNDNKTVNVTKNEPQTTQPVKKGLSSLSLVSGVLSPQFTPDNTVYSVILNSVDTNKFSIKAVPANEGDKVSAVDTHTKAEINLSNIEFVTSGGNDSMSITINVGEGSNLVTYTVLIRKPLPVSKEHVLASLRVGGQNVTLIKDKYDYEVILDDVSSYKVEATLKENDKYDLVLPINTEGENQYPIVVTPKDNTSGLSSTTYTVTVKKSGIVPETTTTTTKKVEPVETGNPHTGGHPALVMAIMLISSLALSLYLYKKNIEGYY